MSDELWRLGACELAERIAARDVSSREVVDAHLARIDAVNPRVNAVVRRMDESARLAADEADRAIAAGAPLGPFHGVPFTVKENIDVAGTPTTNSLPALADAVAAIDAPVVERMKAAGAIVIGRTNLPDVGLRVTTESTLHGVTRNPWHPDRSAGGSSGGEAVAIATGMSPLGLGNDLGGSLRNPAHACGIASIKPSTGVVPSATVVPPEDSPIMFQLMGVEGVMARTVADVRLGLTTIAGPHRRDPLALPVVLAGAPDRRLRVAVLTDPPGGSTHPEVAAGVRRAADALANRGAEVVDAAPPSFAEAIELWSKLLVEDIRAQFPLLQMVLGADAARFLEFSLQLNEAVDTATHLDRFVARHRVEREWHAFLSDHDVLLCPVWANPPFRHGADVASFDDAVAAFETFRPVTPMNLLGLPAAVVPVGFADGTPTAVQVVARRFGDLVALDVAALIEQALGTLTPIDPRW